MNNERRFMAPLLGLMIFSSTASATPPVFSNVTLSPTGLLSGNVEDRGLNQIDVHQPVNLIITVDGDTQNQVSTYSKGGPPNTFSVQLNNLYLDGNTHSVELKAKDNHTNNEKITTLSGTLSAPANSAPTLTNLNVSSTGAISGNINDLDNPNKKLLVEVSIDGNAANRQWVSQGTPFHLQTPSPYLNGLNHNFVVTVHDANLPGVTTSAAYSTNVTMPPNSLPDVFFTVSDDGYINGTATDEDADGQALVVMLTVDGNSQPVSVITLAKPQFRIMIPTQFIGATHTFQVHVEDANIPLMFTQAQQTAQVSAALALNSNNNREPYVAMGFDINGNGTAIVYDADQPTSDIKIQRHFDAPNSPFAISLGGDEWVVQQYGSNLFARENIDSGFRTAQEQDLYGNQTARTIPFTVPVSNYNDFNRNHPIEIRAIDPTYNARFSTDSAHYPVSSTRSLLVDKVDVLETYGLFGIDKTFQALSDSFGNGMAMSGVEMMSALWEKELKYNKNSGLGDCETSVPIRDSAGNTIQDDPSADIPSGAPTTRFHDCRPEHEAKQLEEIAEEVAEKYKPVALVNRVDLSLSGEDCGEFRIVYAREELDSDNNVDPLKRNLVIFEARLSNPTPGNLNGCLAVQQFWQDQVTIVDPIERAQALHQFFHTGIQSYDAVLIADNFRSLANGGSNGQIRTNQFLTPNAIDDILDLDLATAIQVANATIKPWVLKEFKLTHNPDTPYEQFQVNDSPIGHLFNNTLDYSPEPEEEDNGLLIPYPANVGSEWVTFSNDFRTAFLNQNNLKCLMQTDLNKMANNLAHKGKPFNDSQSYSSPVGFVVGILDSTDDQFEQSNYLLEARKGTFETTLQNAISSMCSSLANGSPDQDTLNVYDGVNCDLDAEQVLNRATALSCGGCHQPSLHGLTSIADENAVGPGQSWPDSHGVDGLLSLFVHVTSERNTDDPTRYDISPALREQFLPFRASIMRDFLSTDASTQIEPEGQYDLVAFLNEHGPKGYCN